MIVALNIRSDDGCCDENCCFFHKYPSTSTAECFLFNELLRQKKIDDEPDYWQSCHNCIKVCDKVKSQDIN